MKLFAKKQGNPNVLEDDWDSILDAYEPQNQPAHLQNIPQETTCLRLIREKYSHLDSSKTQQSLLNQKQVELNYTLQIHLIYNQSLAADIITTKSNFNQMQMTRYTMTYDHIPKSMFQKFVDQVTLDHTLCESVKIPDP